MSISDDLAADRSAQDIVTATLIARGGMEPGEARCLAVYLLLDLFSADWYVLARANLSVVAQLVTGGAA